MAALELWAERGVHARFNKLALMNVERAEARAPAIQTSTLIIAGKIICGFQDQRGEKRG